MNVPRLFLTAGGLGLLRPGPGTWASLPPVLLAVGIAGIGVPAWQVSTALVALGVVFAVACLWFGGAEEQRTGVQDPQHIVADEVAGQSLALLGLPWSAPEGARGWLMNIGLGLTAFVAFRVLDILKPPPIRQAQALPGAWGILIDDLAAGALALLIVHIVAWLVMS